MKLKILLHHDYAQIWTPDPKSNKHTPNLNLNFFYNYDSIQPLKAQHQFPKAMRHKNSLLIFNFSFTDLTSFTNSKLELIQEIQLSSSDEGNKKSNFSLIPKSSTTENTSVIPIL